MNRECRPPDLSRAVGVSPCSLQPHLGWGPAAAGRRQRSPQLRREAPRAAAGLQRHLALAARTAPLFLRARRPPSALVGGQFTGVKRGGGWARENRKPGERERVRAAGGTSNGRLCAWRWEGWDRRETGWMWAFREKTPKPKRGFSGQGVGVQSSVRPHLSSPRAPAFAPAGAQRRAHFARGSVALGAGAGVSSIKSNTSGNERPGRLPRHRAAGRSSPEPSREAGPPPPPDAGRQGGVTRRGPGRGGGGRRGVSGCVRGAEG